jgi:hypothetical protein
MGVTKSPNAGFDTQQRTLLLNQRLGTPPGDVSYLYEFVTAQSKNWQIGIGDKLGLRRAGGLDSADLF